MRIPRRDFVRLLGVSAGALGAGGCGREWLVPDRLVERALRGPGLETHLQSVCGLCETGCGLTVRLVDGLPVGLKGNPQHPLNRGGLCPVGQAALDVLYAPERLQVPLRRAGDGRYTTTTWAEALDEIASRLSELHARQAAERIALISEEPGELFAGLAERFARALGTPNLAPRRGLAALPFSLSQGLDVIPGFDLAQSDLVLSFGLDLYEDGAAPLHAISALVGVRPDEARATLLHVGTRLSPSAAKAEQRIAIRPGTHAAFALGVAQVLVREGRCDTRFLAEHTHGFEDWSDGAGRRRLGFRRLLIERYYPDRAAQLCGCDPTQIVRTARRFAEASAPLALVGGEALRASNASWTAVAVHALNALVGAFDRPGGVVLPAPVPLAPLPPLAEPGGAAARRSVFAADGSGGSLGIDPIEALAERVLDGSHPIDVLFVVGANPVHDSPAGPRLREALERIPLVVSLTPFRDETAACADLVLPSHVFLEGWQGTTTPATVAFSVVGLSHPVVEPLYDTRHPADVLLELGRRVAGTGPLPWESYTGCRASWRPARGRSSVTPSRRPGSTSSRSAAGASWRSDIARTSGAGSSARRGGGTRSGSAATGRGCSARRPVASSSSPPASSGSCASWVPRGTRRSATRRRCAAASPRSGSRRRATRRACRTTSRPASRAPEISCWSHSGRSRRAGTRATAPRW